MFVPVERIIQTPGFGSIIRYIYPIHESHMLRAHDYQLDSLYALYAQTGRQAPQNDIRLNIAHFFFVNRLYILYKISGTTTKSTEQSDIIVVTVFCVIFQNKRLQN